MKYLSIVIPVYNEASRISSLDRVHTFFNSLAFSYEVIIVNDGSTDETLKLLKLKQKKLKFKILSYDKNRGKGYAVKCGLLRASGRYSLFMDVDLSTDPSEFLKYIPLLSKYEVIIGSRRIKGAQLLVRQSNAREFFGKYFTSISRLLLGIQVSDFTCGFKCFSRRASSEIFQKSMIERWGFDCEILFIAKHLGFRIREVPVRWTNNKETKVRFPQDLFNSCVELLKIRIYEARGKYNFSDFTQGGS